MFVLVFSLQKGKMSYSCLRLQPDDLEGNTLGFKEILPSQEDINIETHITFFFLEFCILGKTDDSYYYRTAHTHKSCQYCLEGSPQLLSG